MTAISHNVLMLALVAICLSLLWRYLVRRGINPGHDLRVVIRLGAILTIVSLLSAVTYDGNQFGMMQLLAWSVFLHGSLFLLGLAVLYWQRRPGLVRGALAVVGCLGLVALDAFVIEPHWLDVNTVTLTSRKLDAPLRVVILADIQTDRPGAYEARVLETAMAQTPDLILFAGDYIHLGRKSRSYEAEMAALRELLVAADVRAPLGVYAIGGNVDQPGQWMRIFDGLPVTIVETTTSYDLGPVTLTGLTLADAFSINLTLPPEDKFHIVLGHSPNFSLSPGTGDLLIAGHMHGGQVQLPFIGPLMTLTVAPRDWASGVTAINDDTTLIVSRGVGMERADAPRLRFLCRPELVVVDLLPE